MSIVETKPMTADGFYDFVHRPENEGKYFELERGEVVEMPPPGEIHGVVCGIIAYILNTYVFRRRQGQVCCNDTGVTIEHDPDTVRGPDIMLFLESRRFDQLSPKYPDRIPALIVEVRSPNDQPTKTQRRISDFLRRGVPLVWLVDPEARSVTVYPGGRPHFVVDDTEELTGETVLPDFRCKVADFFTLADESPV